MQVTEYSEQKRSTDCQPQLNSLSVFCLLHVSDFGKIHQQATKNCIQLQFLSKWDLRYLKEYHFNELYLNYPYSCIFVIS